MEIKVQPCLFSSPHSVCGGRGYVCFRPNVLGSQQPGKGSLQWLPYPEMFQKMPSSKSRLCCFLNMALTLKSPRAQLLLWRITVTAHRYFRTLVCSWSCASGSPHTTISPEDRYRAQQVSFRHLSQSHPVCSEFLTNYLLKYNRWVASNFSELIGILQDMLTQNFRVWP